MKNKSTCKPFRFDRFIRIDLRLDIQAMGSQCPAPPKIKIYAALGLFGIVYFVLLSYTMLRNIFYNKIE